MIANPLREESNIRKLYKNKIRKISGVESYSSDNVEKLSKKELKKMMIQSGLLESNKINSAQVFF